METNKSPWPFNGYAPGNYMNKCSVCEKVVHNVDKLCFVCLECAVLMVKESPTGYTGSEVADELILLKNEVRTLEYKGQKVTILYHFYEDAQSREKWTTTQLDEINIAHVHYAYNSRLIPAKGDAVKVLDWLLKQSDLNILIMNDGCFYYESDKDGDQELEPEDIVKMYLKENPQSTPTPPGIVEADNEKVIKNTIWSLVHAWQMSDGDDTKDRWVAVENYAISISKHHSVNTGLVARLKEENPYRYNKEEVEKWRAYTKCCDTLATLYDNELDRMGKLCMEKDGEIEQRDNEIARLRKLSEDKGQKKEEGK
jgi:hypothetical protein